MCCVLFVPRLTGAVTAYLTKTPVLYMSFRYFLIPVNSSYFPAKLVKPGAPVQISPDSLRPGTARPSCELQSDNK